MFRKKTLLDPYEENIIKKYTYWTVYAHTNQGYLGRCVIWCDREDALDLSDATTEEVAELMLIIKQLKVALEKAFQADWMNYAFLGNADRHLHAHLVPRYASERSFFGQVFTDSRWGHNWAQDRGFITSTEVLQGVKNVLKNELLRMDTL